jgi:hypothetical protein
VSKLSFIIVAATSLMAFGSAAGCAAPTDGDDEPVGESQDHLLAGRRLSPSEVARLVREAGFPESVVGKMVCTAKYESSFYERASNRNHNGSTDYGLFQINSVHFGDSGCPTSSSGLYDAARNARCAYAVYRMQGLNAWYGYRRHKTECNNTRAPASSGSSDSDPQVNTTDDTGGCYSATLEDMMDGRTCVQSKFDGVWYQCANGEWYRGVSGSSGPYGECKSTHPL